MAAQLTIEVQPGAGEVRLRLEGELDLTSSVGLRACCDVLDPAWRHVVLDLGGVSFLDSTGIHELVHVRDRCEAEGRTMVLTQARPNVRRVLEIAAIEDLLPNGVG
jgi:stage II sporulation protein AA (anti-sigma F factor antagonist)